MLLWRIFPNAPGDVDRWRYFAHEQPHSALPAERLDATADGLDPSGLETMKSVTGLRPFLAMVACAGILSGCGAAVAPRAVSGGASEPSTPTAASSSPTTGPVATEATAAAQAADAAAAVAKQAADGAAAAQQAADGAAAAQQAADAATAKQAADAAAAQQSVAAKQAADAAAKQAADEATAKQAADAAAAQAVPTAPPAPAAPPASIVVFANCAQLNGVYPHGVGRPGAVDQVSGGSAGVTTFDRDAAVYGANTGRDRDKDGVACEKK
jgi:hypothetical protein